MLYSISYLVIFSSNFCVPNSKTGVRILVYVLLIVALLLAGYCLYLRNQCINAVKVAKNAIHAHEELNGLVKRVENSYQEKLNLSSELSIQLIWLSEYLCKENDKHKRLDIMRDFDIGELSDEFKTLYGRTIEEVAATKSKKIKMGEF
jgi:hypothetical protein